ncbi:2-oxo-4-hydroxy-4-carboxy-5-ureidoimidazoline decarboxylase [soil metagenome]
MIAQPASLSTINAMLLTEFIAAFGDVAEHSPWVAEAATKARPFASSDAMINAFEAALRNGPKPAQLALIRAHPDLAGKARLTADSSKEQAGAGLDTLTEEEMQRFTILNDTYKSRFGFPFIFAVKGATKHQILAAFEARLSHDADKEFATALAQIARIFRFRIEDRVSS